MRLNTGTIVLLVISLVVIGGVILFNNNQAAAPGNETATPTAGAGGPLFPGVDQNTVTRFEVRNNLTGQLTVMDRQADMTWTVSDREASGGQLSGMVNSALAGASGGQQVDQTQVVGTMGVFASLAATDSFQSDAEHPVSAFGLDHPEYSLMIVTQDGGVYTMHVGAKNPQGTRYYAVVQTTAGSAAAAATDVVLSRPEEPSSVVNTEVPEAGDDAGATAEATALVGANPTLDALATALVEATSEAEVTELAEQLSTAVVATNAAAGATLDANNAQVEAQATAIVEATSEAEATELAEQLSTAVVATNAAAGATLDANNAVAAVATPAAPAGEATDVVLSRPEEPSSVENTEVPEVTGEAQAEATGEATGEATVDAAATEGAESTVEPPAEPLVSLSDPQTIYLVPASDVGNLINLITRPPYIIPTPTETPFPTANPYSEVQQTATATIEQGATLQAFATMVQMMTDVANVTPEATAAP
jgi:hypothetical protein